MRSDPAAPTMISALDRSVRGLHSLARDTVPDIVVDASPAGRPNDGKQIANLPVTAPFRSSSLATRRHRSKGLRPTPASSTASDSRRANRIIVRPRRLTWQCKALCQTARGPHRHKLALMKVTKSISAGGFSSTATPSWFARAIMAAEGEPVTIRAGMPVAACRRCAMSSSPDIDGIC